MHQHISFIEGVETVFGEYDDQGKVEKLEVITYLREPSRGIR